MTGVQTCALPICLEHDDPHAPRHGGSHRVTGAERLVDANAEDERRDLDLGPFEPAGDPSATSPSEEVEEHDEDEEPLPKRQKRKSGESASTSSPLKETSVEDKEETSGSSSGATHTSNPEEPLVVHPLSSAPPSKNKGKRQRLYA